MKQDPLLKYLALTILVGVVIAIVDPTKTVGADSNRADPAAPASASR